MAARMSFTGRPIRESPFSTRREAGLSVLRQRLLALSRSPSCTYARMRFIKESSVRPARYITTARSINTYTHTSDSRAIGSISHPPRRQSSQSERSTSVVTPAAFAAAGAPLSAASRRNIVVYSYWIGINHSSGQTLAIAAYRLGEAEIERVADQRVTY